MAFRSLQKIPVRVFFIVAVCMICYRTEYQSSSKFVYSSTVLHCDSKSVYSEEGVIEGQNGAASSIPSRVGAYAAAAAAQSMSDPGLLQRPDTDPAPADPIAAVQTAHGTDGVNGADLASHPLTSAGASPVMSPEPHGAFGSFLHGHLSPSGASRASAGSQSQVIDTDKGTVQPDHQDAVPQTELPPHINPPNGLAGGLGSPGQVHAQGLVPDDAAAMNSGREVDGGEAAVEEIVGHQGEPGAEDAGASAAEVVEGHSGGLLGPVTDEHDAQEWGRGDAGDMQADAQVPFDPQYAPAPADGEVPSPWVLYWYSDWPSTTWEALFAYSPELFYFHFQLKAQAESWGDAEWLAYREQCPDHCEHIEYFNVEWGNRGTPMYPMPQEGQPLVGGGYATSEWLASTQTAIEEAQADGGADTANEPGAAEDPQDQYAANGRAELSEEPVAAVPYGAEVLSDEVTLMQQHIDGDERDLYGGTETPRLLSADALVAASASDAPVSVSGGHVHGEAAVNGYHAVEEAGYFPGSATASPSGRILRLEDLDYVPDMEQVQELIARYAVPMRPESCAGSDDDRLYRAQPGANGSAQPPCNVANFGLDDSRGRARSRRSSSTSGTDGTEEDDDDGPDPGHDAEDAEDGFGDMGSMLAVASPSSCHRHEEEARVATGTLGTAVAAAESAAAMRHLEAALDTKQVRSSCFLFLIEAAA